MQAVFGTGLSNRVVGSGSIVASPAGGMVPFVPFGTQVRLTAVPQAGNYFVQWGSAASGTNHPLSFAVTSSNPVVTAVFAALPGGTHALTVVPEGFGAVSASPRANRYNTGTNVTLTALPDAGQSFLGWSGGASGTNNPLVVTMNQSRVITANFTKRPRLAPVLCRGVANAEEFQMRVTGEFGGRYVIEAAPSPAPDAPGWEPVGGTVTTPFGTAQFNDAIPTNGMRRFYRAVTGP